MKMINGTVPLIRAHTRDSPCCDKLPICNYSVESAAMIYFTKPSNMVQASDNLFA